MPPSIIPNPRPIGIAATRNSVHVGTVASAASPIASRTKAAVRTTRRPILSVSRPPPIEPPTDATALTKKKTPTPASSWPNAGSMDRMSDGTSRPAQPRNASPAHARSAAGSIRPGVGEDTPQMLAASRAVYGRDMADAKPSGILFFVHGANDTSAGHATTIARLEDQVRAL